MGTASLDQTQRTFLSRWSLPNAPRQLYISVPAVTPWSCRVTCSLLKKTRAYMQDPSTGNLKPWGPRASTVTLMCDLDRPGFDPRDSDTRVHHQSLSFLCILPGYSSDCIQF